MKILFITTGGSIDKDYNKKKEGYNFEFGTPAIKKLMEKINPSIEFEIKSILKKDSQDFTNEDRQQIFQTCIKSTTQKIIVTHGTDTMIESASYIYPVPGKVVIFTGAFKPYKMEDSDAEFNLGVAVGAVQILRRGVHVAMNGLVLPCNEMMRDEEGKFVPLTVQKSDEEVNYNF